MHAITRPGVLALPISGAASNAESADETGARLGVALLGYMLAVVLVVTLAPFRFAVPDAMRITLAGGAADLISNIALFLPLGFLGRLARPDPADRYGLRVFGLGMLLSATIETAQLFENARYTALPDVIANGAGAWLGAHMQRRIARRLQIDGNTVGRLALELPLMGLIYLLVPLLLVNSLAIGDDPSRFWLTLLVGLFGGSLLGSVQRDQFRPAGFGSAWRMAAVAAIAFGVGSFPALPVWPVPVLICTVLVAGLTAFRASSASDADPAERRFEGRALRDAAPFFGAYLFLLACTPFAAHGSAWTVQWGLGRAASIGNTELLRLLEGVAAFTVLGYLLAESRGRLELPFRTVAAGLFIACGTAALLSETMRGFTPPDGASGLRSLLMLSGGLYGGWLYHLQRAHIRRLLESTRTPPAWPLPVPAPQTRARALRRIA